LLIITFLVNAPVGVLAGAGAASAPIRLAYVRLALPNFQERVFFGIEATRFAAGQRSDTINLIPERETAGQVQRFAQEVMPLARAETGPVK
jgi:hypothetical protein